ncbi:MAG: OmpA family protein [Flavobacteriales bacterium]|nr:OmpA family protein [Flavobacteriales bacterium]
MLISKARLVHFFSLLLLLTFVTGTNLSAQYIKRSTADYDTLNISKQLRSNQVRQLIESARGFFIDNDFNSAKRIYLEIVKADSISPELYYELGLTFYNSPDEPKTSSVPYLEKSLFYSVENDTIVETFYYLAKCHQMAGKHNLAMNYFLRFKDQVKSSYMGTSLMKELNREIEMCVNAVFFEENRDESTVITNLGSDFNSGASEYAPVLGADFKTMIYTSRGSKNGQDEYGSNYKQVYINHQDTNGTWTTPITLENSKKMLLNNFEVGASIIGFANNDKKLYVFQRNKIFVTDFLNDEWSTLEEVQSRAVDRKSYEPSLFFSSDGKRMFLSSDRKGGFGGLDIYVSELQEDDSWGPAVNLGAAINSEYDEDSPFLSYDGKKLFFSSKGHNSMGDYDVFYSEVIGGKWTRPRNLRPPINSTGKDIYFMTDQAGKVGFIASSREGGSGDMDIYSFEIECKFLNKTTIRGVINANDTKPGITRITFTNTLSEKKVITYAPASNRAIFTAHVLTNADYEVTIEKVGYAPQTHYIYTPKQCEEFEIFQEINMSRTKSKQKVVIADAFFDIQKYTFAKYENLYEKGIINSYVNYVASLKEITTDLNLKVTPYENKISKEDVILAIEKKKVRNEDIEDVDAKPRAIVTREIRRLHDNVYIVNLHFSKKDIHEQGTLVETIPEGFRASYVENAGGEFTIKDNDVRILWQNIPINSTFDVTYQIDAVNERPLMRNDKVRGVFTYIYDFDIHSQNITSTNFPAFKDRPLGIEETVAEVKEASIKVIDITKDDLFTEGDSIIAVKEKLELEANKAKLALAKAQKEKESEAVAVIAVADTTATKESIPTQEVALKETITEETTTQETAEKEVTTQETTTQETATKETAAKEEEQEETKETAPPAKSTTQIKATDASDDFEFKPIQYGFDGYLLNFEAKKEMARVSDYLNKNKVEIEIGGHTDNTGTRAYNEFLSNKRAELAKSYLVDKGIAKERMETKGYGEDFPIATNTTKEGRRLNRRVEMVRLPKTKDFIATRTYGHSLSKIRKANPNAIPYGSLGHYSIQVGAYRVFKYPEHFKGLDNVTNVKGEDGIYRYLFGEYKTQKETMQILKKLNQLGYKDAFIRY